MDEQYLETKNIQTQDGKDSESSIREEFYRMPWHSSGGEGIDSMENGFEFSQSEIIDFSQGTDSSTEGNP